jgi:murein DD-endopeptidase MepM/ murein hydrolase activator NlpD
MFNKIQEGKEVGNAEKESAYSFNEATGEYDKTSDWDETHVIIDGPMVEVEELVAEVNGEAAGSALVEVSAHEGKHTVQNKADFAKKVKDPKTGKYKDPKKDKDGGASRSKDYEDREYEKEADAAGKKHERNTIGRMMSMRQILIVVSLTFTSFALLGQELGCPIEGGSFKNFNGSLYSHYNPKEGAVILSRSNNRVRAVVDGKVSKILNHGNNQYSVVLLSTDSAIVSYSLLQVVSVQEDVQVRNGDVIGRASKDVSGNFEMRFSYRIRSSQVDPKELIRCQN